MKELILIILAAVAGGFIGHQLAHDARASEIADLATDIEHRDRDLEQSHQVVINLESQIAKLEAAALATAPTESAATSSAPTGPAPSDPVAAVAPLRDTAAAQATAAAAAAANQANLARALADLDSRAQVPTRQLAEARARRAQAAAMQGQFQEQRINPKTGEKSGIRTSDADRSQWEASKAAELHRLDAYIADRQRALDDLATERARLLSDN